MSLKEDLARLFPDTDKPLWKQMDELTYGLKLYEHKNPDKKEAKYIISMMKNGRNAVDYAFDYDSYGDALSTISTVKDLYLCEKRLIAIALSEIAFARRVNGDKYSITEPAVKIFQTQIDSASAYNESKGRPLFIDKTDYNLIADYSSKRHGIHYYTPLQPTGKNIRLYDLREIMGKTTKNYIEIKSVSFVSYDTFVSSFLPENMNPETKKGFYDERPYYMLTDPDVAEVQGNIRIMAKDLFDVMRIYFEKHPEKKEELLKERPELTIGLPDGIEAKDLALHPTRSIMNESAFKTVKDPSRAKTIEEICSEGIMIDLYPGERTERA